MGAGRMGQAGTVGGKQQSVVLRVLQVPGAPCVAFLPAAVPENGFRRSRRVCCKGSLLLQDACCAGAGMHRFSCSSKGGGDAPGVFSTNSEQVPAPVPAGLALPSLF